MDVVTPKGLADHAESVSCYLYEYGRAGDKALRSKYSKSFFLYLLAASWMKLHARFRSWRALSFIRELERGITEGYVVSQIEEIGNDYGPVIPQVIGPGDCTLADFFSKNEKFLCEMITYACHTLPDEIRIQLSKLVNPSPSESEDAIHDKTFTFNVFGEAVERTLKEKKPLYTKETALTFHYLLYFAFLMAGRALRGIKDYHQKFKSAAPKKRSEPAQDYKSEIEAAELPIRFLICMLSSKAFKSHITVWTSKGASLKVILPRFTEKRDCMIFGKDRDILALSKQGPDPELELTLENYEDDMIDSEVREPIC